MKKNLLLIFLLFSFYFSKKLNLLLEEDETEPAVEPPTFSEKSGFYDKEFSLSLSCPQEGELFYTTDSTNPLDSETAQSYKDPIKIYDKSEEPNVYAEMGDDQNSPAYVGSMEQFQRPKYLIDKAMVIRAYCKNKEGNSKVYTNIYFVTTGNLEKYQDFTIVSLVTNPDDLFDPDKGIYVVGNEYYEKKKNSAGGGFGGFGNFDLMFAANFYKEGPEWEKETNLVIFEKGEISVQQNVGIKIRGFSTRMQAGKSFNVYSKKRFGKKNIKSALFPNNYDMNNTLIEKYKSIALRNVFSEERIKDEFGNKLLYGREFQSISDSKKCILFLNGEYWGFYIMMEKFSESYIESHFNVPKDQVTLIKEGELSNGDESELDLYNNFFTEYSKKDVLSSSVYEEINNVLDIDSFIEHFAIGIYIGTWDWPGHNDGVWRYSGEKIENNPYSDGRWRYITFDLDYSMGNTFSFFGGWGGNQEPGYAKDNIAELEKNKKGQSTLFLMLLKNEDFKKKYALRFCDFANAVFNLDRVDALINDYKDNYLEMLANGEVRWKGFKYSSEAEAFATFKTNYVKAFNDLRVFFKERPEYALKHMKQHLSLEGDLQEIAITKEGEGKIKINSITPEFKDGKWAGKYFSNIPVSITAIPSKDSKFKGWSGDVTSEELTISVDMTKDTAITAKFE